MGHVREEHLVRAFFLCEGQFLPRFWHCVRTQWLDKGQEYGLFGQNGVCFFGARGVKYVPLHRQKDKR